MVVRQNQRNSITVTEPRFSPSCAPTRYQQFPSNDPSLNEVDLGDGRILVPCID